MILNGTCKTVPTYLQSGWVHTQMPFLHMFTPKGSLAFSETTDYNFNYSWIQFDGKVCCKAHGFETQNRNELLSDILE